jgi:hypothetical protein
MHRPDDSQAERDRIDELCSLIATEENHQKLLTFVEELNRLLSAKSKRFQHDKAGERSTGT